MSITVTRRIEFDAGHRLQKHESKCRNLHGHRYVAEVTVEGPELDEVGRVVDFGVVKQAVGGWVDTYWDHGLLLEGSDPVYALLASEEYRTSGPTLGTLPPLKMWLCDAPPTAENMVKWLANEAQNVLGHVLKVTHVRLYETPNCWADYAVPLALRFSTRSQLETDALTRDLARAAIMDGALEPKPAAQSITAALRSREDRGSTQVAGHEGAHDDLPF